MVIRHYRVDIVTRDKKVVTSFTFTAGTYKKAVEEANRLKQGLGCAVCSGTRAVVTLLGKSIIEPEKQRPGRPQKEGFTKYFGKLSTLYY